MKNFIIQNKTSFKQLCPLDLLYSNNDIELYADDYSEDIVTNDLIILIKGYVVSRTNDNCNDATLSPISLVNHNFLEHHDDFVKYVKGIFTIIIVYQGKIKVFNDHFGMSKFFYFEMDERIALSNNLIYFKSMTSFEFDKLSLITNDLLNSIPGEYTIFKNIFQSQAAQVVQIERNNLKHQKYWNPSMINLNDVEVDKNKSYLKLKEKLIANFSIINHLTPKSKRAITLTGGKDSRTGLAILKCLNQKIIGFTYGNSKSIDALVAHDLANEVGVEHQTFEPKDTDISYFQKMADEIVSLGNPNISIHRAHRLNAFKEYATIYGDDSTYFAGYMAGEFLMGVYYDNLIFSKYVTDVWNNQNNDVKYSSNILYKADKSALFKRLNELENFSEKRSVKMNEFFGLFEIGIPHHSQDTFLASNYFKTVYPFFIDIDFVEYLFQTKYSFLKVNNKSVNPFQRYYLYEFNLKIQHDLCPEMDNVKFGKRGEYSTREYLKGKVYWSVIKTLRFLLNRKKHPANYKYNRIFLNFLLDHLKCIKSDSANELNQIFDIEQLITDLENYNGNFSEKSLKKFSNVVMYNLYKKRIDEN